MDVGNVNCLASSGTWRFYWAPNEPGVDCSVLRSPEPPTFWHILTDSFFSLSLSATICDKEQIGFFNPRGACVFIPLYTLCRG